MSPLVAVLLGLTVLAALVGGVATLRLARPLDRLHVGGFVAVAGGVPLTLAVLLADGFTARGLKSLLILLVLLAGNAVTSHAIARAIHLRGGEKR